MAKAKFYRQCKLQKGCMHTTSWLPEKYANQGKYVKLKTAGMWTNGWRILEVGVRLGAELVYAKNQEHKHHRKRTDI